MNLWRVAIDERSGRPRGEPEPVTTPSPYSGSMSFSRDGRRLAYVQQIATSNIHRIEFDPRAEKVAGQPVPITRGSRQIASMAAAADGEWIAFATGGAQEDLFVMRKDGAGMRQLTDDPYRDRQPRWSPDGKRLLFYSNRSGEYEAWVIHADGSGAQQLTFTPDANVVRFPAWSPNGKQISVIFDQTSYIMEAEKPWKEQSPQALPAGPDPKESLGAADWSPDGRRLAGQYYPAEAGIGVYSFDSRQYRKLTSSGWLPVWLRDSRRLLFTDQSIKLVDTESGKVRQVLSLAPHESLAVALSPDDRHIYFVLGVTEADIWLASLY